MVLVKEAVRSCTSAVKCAEVQVRVQFLKDLSALSTSGALKMPAPSILVLKSFYSVIIAFFVGFFFFFYARH